MIWLGAKQLKNVTKGFKITKAIDRAKFNKNIMQQKPYSRITRKPRSILERSFYKAVEYKNLLWFYGHYALYGVLCQSAINNLLSAATYILNKPTITIEEVNRACAMLEKFVDQFEGFYGADAITMNLHMLKHYRQNVLNGGPLWAHSMFGFECRMGDMKKCQRSKVCISEPTAKKYCLSKPDILTPKKKYRS